jgi:Lhr-like helicase
MARRKFRDIAVIGGLIFQGYPGEHKKARHLQASAGLLFNVFSEYEPDHLLIRQAYQEVFDPADGRVAVERYATPGAARQDHHYISATAYTVLLSHQSR